MSFWSAQGGTKGRRFEQVQRQNEGENGSLGEGERKEAREGVLEVDKRDEKRKEGEVKENERKEKGF